MKRKNTEESLEDDETKILYLSTMPPLKYVKVEIVHLSDMPPLEARR